MNLKQLDALSRTVAHKAAERRRMAFQKATKKRSKLRLGIVGPSGSGKTYTALAIADGLKALGGTVAVIDTECGSASLYADRFDFDVLELAGDYHPQRYIDAIHQAEEAGYRVCVIDSLTHAWSGQGGALELVDNAVARQHTKNSYTAWREVTPLHNALVDAMLQSPMHIIATVRSKTEYVQEKDEKGKTVVRKVGMAPIQRDGLEYEFTVVGDMDLEHKLVVTKSRCHLVADKVFRHPGADVAKVLLDWLNSGEESQPEPPKAEHKAIDPDKTRLNDLMLDCGLEDSSLRRKVYQNLTKSRKPEHVMDTAIVDFEKLSMWLFRGAISKGEVCKYFEEQSENVDQVGELVWSLENTHTEKEMATV